MFHVRVRLQERKDARVRRGVAEAGDGALDKRGEETLVVPCVAAFVVEGFDGGGCGGAVAVLVVHDGAEGLWGWRVSLSY